MREAARALDDVSDHLGEVLRRADELLAEWSKFGAQVRGQVEREAGAVGQIVESAVGRVAAQGIDRAITERLRSLTLEIERLEQRTRAASHAVVERRDQDRRILWAVIAGIVLANALLVVLLLRKPPAAPAAEPIRLDSTAPQSTGDPGGTTPAGNAAGAATPGPVGPDGAGGTAPTPGAATSGASGSGMSGAGASKPGAGPGGGQSGAPQSGAPQGNGQQLGPSQGGTEGSASPAASATSSGGAKAASGAAHPTEPSGVKASPIALPPKAGTTHPHKKLP
jgi:hypothetical protein